MIHFLNLKLKTICIKLLQCWSIHNCCQLMVLTRTSALQRLKEQWGNCPKIVQKSDTFQWKQQWGYRVSIKLRRLPAARDWGLPIAPAWLLSYRVRQKTCKINNACIFGLGRCDIHRKARSRFAGMPGLCTALCRSLSQSMKTYKAMVLGSNCMFAQKKHNLTL